MDSEADEYVGGDGTGVADEDIKQQVAATDEAMEENAMETNAAGDFNMEAGEEMITAQQMKEEAATGHGNEGGDASLAEEAQATDVEEAATGLENEGDVGLAEGENFVTEEQEPMPQEEEGVTDKDAQEEEYVPDEQETKAADDEYVPDEQETKAADDDDDYTPYAKVAIFTFVLYFHSMYMILRNWLFHCGPNLASVKICTSITKVCIMRIVHGDVVESYIIL